MAIKQYFKPLFASNFEAKPQQNNLEIFIDNRWLPTSTNRTINLRRRLYLH